MVSSTAGTDSSGESSDDDATAGDGVVGDIGVVNSE